MEAYTTMKMTVKDTAKANEVADLFKNTIMSKVNDDFSKKYVPVFCNDMKIRENEIVVDDSCSLSSSEVEFFKDVLATIAAEKDCEFTLEAKYEQFTDGFEEYIEAEYKNGVLTYKIIGDDCMLGWCSNDDCGEYIVHVLDYDPSKTYTCPECGRVVPEEELFPNGVPTWEIEEIKIR